MKTLKALKSEIESKQHDYRTACGMNSGVSRGWIATNDLKNEIKSMIAEYNRRSVRAGKFENGIFKK